MRSIAMLLDAFPDETVVYPGHMAVTTLGAERATNPFLVELRATSR
jgi:glyoxylase-like metal-dependent hydrolase (beta-lactamase superfamily II)